MREEQDDFVKAENIKNFKRQLEAETDPEKRRVLTELLEHEKAGSPSRAGEVP